MAQNTTKIRKRERKSYLNKLSIRAIAGTAVASFTACLLLYATLHIDQTQLEQSKKIQPHAFCSYTHRIFSESSSKIVKRILSGDTSSGSLIIFFSIFGLFIGSVLKEVKKKTNIPYSPMLLGVGMIIGYFHKKLDLFGESTSIVNSIDPHTMLMVFIPGLVFEGAYNSDGYVLNKSKW
jgi:uncharacterized membrane protein YjjP (DUF1212 family)